MNCSGSTISVCKENVELGNCSPEQVLLVNYNPEVTTTDWFTAEAQTYILKFEHTGDRVYIKQRAEYDSFLFLAEVYFQGTHQGTYTLHNLLLSYFSERGQ